MACSINECELFLYKETANIIIILTILRYCIPRIFDLFTPNSCVGQLNKSVFAASCLTVSTFSWACWLTWESWERKFSWWNVTSDYFSDRNGSKMTWTILLIYIIPFNVSPRTRMMSTWRSGHHYRKWPPEVTVFTFA